MRPSSAWTHALEARQNRWEFMLVVAPHVIPGGTGQFVNPLAMF